MRLQLALNVRDLNEAVAFYSKLFGVTPHKQRDGYANFAVQNPPLKLVLFEDPAATERLNHLGVEVFGQSELEAATERLAKADLLVHEEKQKACCHAVQNKSWAREPQGLNWEWYRITDDNPVAEEPPVREACC